MKKQKPHKTHDTKHYQQERENYINLKKIIFFYIYKKSNLSTQAKKN